MTARSRHRIHLAREQPSPDRRCQQCGDLIDPVDWCPGCRATTPPSPCGRPHKRLRKRADAAFCGPGCRAERRASYIRDCL